MKLRLSALEEKVAKDGAILTESQLVALERAQLEKEPHGEIQTAPPGYLGSKDPFYVGRLKGVGAVLSRPLLIRTLSTLFASCILCARP